MNEKFTKDFDELCKVLGKTKGCVKRYLVKHFKENVDYICSRIIQNTPKSHGGHNRENILVTEEIYQLIQNSYDLKHRYINKIRDMEFKNCVIMNLENSTIGFIENCLNGITKVQRQFKIDKYYIDCYIPAYNIAIECDEFGHAGYNYEKECLREEYIKKTLKCNFIRFNPSEPSFDISNVLNILLREIFPSV